MTSNIQLSTRRQLELMQQLQELANARAQAEQEVAATLAAELLESETELETATTKLAEESAQQRRQLENDFAQAKKDAGDALQRSKTRLQTGFEKKRAESEAIYKKSALAIERKKKESEWQALAVFDAAKGTPQAMLDQASKRFLTRRQQVDGLQRDADTLLSMRRLLDAGNSAETGFEEVDESPLEGSAEERQQANLKELHQAVVALQDQFLPSLLLEGRRPWGWWAAVCLVTTVVGGFLVGWSLWLTPVVGLIGGSAMAATVYALVGRKAQRQSISQYSHIQGLLQRAKGLEQAAQEEARQSSREKAEQINGQKNRDLAAAQATRDEAIGKSQALRQAEAEHTQRLLDDGLAKAEHAHDEALTAAETVFPPQMDEIAKQRKADQRQNLERYEQRQSAAHEAHEADWQVLAERWREGYVAVTAELAAMRAACERLFPDWGTTEWDDWQRPTDPPPAMQFGSCKLSLSAVKHALSEDPRLRPEETQIELPALMPFDELPRLVVSAQGAGRKVAAEVLQAMMLRFLTAMPAGKLRFTILDPSALGENFATFMHLADFDEQLVGTRIWTDSRQIDERLGLLSDHMEKVLQKYLRNEFATLREYNEQAGEVAEPYHVLVVANFPSGLSDASIRKLQKIATTGPRCGVYTLLGIDTAIKLPNDFDPTSLFEKAVHLHWAEDKKTGGQMRWDYPLFAKLPLTCDPLPPRDKFNELLRKTGEASRAASRVEVPFAVVAPPSDQLWTESTARELVVPIGRAGAKDLQSLRLGRGTAQHVLISGKTGSGKSTLLHALVTNLALRYSPDEVEFYLVDFKKGVEFKTYATGGLPHARVIAIESEREFGVSVLQRLDEELRRRGESFREQGVQDLAAWREASGEPMPRILLVIDEFQELFVTDDKLSQDAALLLDRLVRQGRAFGIHVLLGSQTLAGAYSLARSTIGQMAVRIALECSDADAHLILSDENSAARLLSRPGEAIYNDQNGMVEGNSPFQVVWLPDAQRKDYLAKIEHMASRAAAQQVEPTIVFEGNRPADQRENGALVDHIQQSETHATNEPTLWLGSAVRIEPATQLTLRRQNGNNLAVVGQEEPLALGILASAVVALAAQQRGAEPCVTILDGTRADSIEQGAWPELAAALPGKVEVHGPSTAAETITRLAEEVERRSADANGAHPAHFLVIHDLSQLRNLRLTEDDFSFSATKNGKPTPPDKQFRTLLREGPAVGVHVLMWCDSYNGLTRFVDRLTLREIDYRVALQMSSADSTSLIDSPAAGRIGEQRAVFYRDDLGTHVKFRPYGRPTAEWLAWVSEHLAVEQAGRT